MVCEFRYEMLVLVVYFYHKSVYLLLAMKERVYHKKCNTNMASH